MKKIIVIIAVLLLFPCVATAQWEDGNKLYKSLSAGASKEAILNATVNEQSDYWVAFGYVMAIWDVYKGVAWTAPANVTRGQIIDVARKFLEENPEKRHESSIKLLLQAFIFAFPKEKKTGEYS